MLKVLLYVKHHICWIWDVIEWLNSFVFNICFGHCIKQSVEQSITRVSSQYDFRLLSECDMDTLAAFFVRQPKESFSFFNPHGFDLKSLRKKNGDKSFIMIGVYDGSRLVGYCFLRCFFTKKAFRGKIVDIDYQGRGIAKQMGMLTTEICKNMKFRLFATISKENVKSISSSKAVNDIKIHKELPDGYYYVEYLVKNDSEVYF